jgi:hypothetical protein
VKDPTNVGKNCTNFGEKFLIFANIFGQAVYMKEHCGQRRSLEMIFFLLSKKFEIFQENLQKIASVFTKCVCYLFL